MSERCRKFQPTDMKWTPMNFQSSALQMEADPDQIFNFTSLQTVQPDAQ